jgi:uncharacterized membrane protein
MRHKRHSKTRQVRIHHEANAPQEAKPRQAREQKREQFTEPIQSSHNLKLYLVIVVLVAVVAYVLVSASNRDSANGGGATVNAVKPAQGTSDIRIPLSEVASGQAKFYEATVADKQVRFFVIKTSDGVYRAALDACQVCNYAKKGYYQDGDEMVCKKCGRHFAVTDVNDGTSGCHPVGLTRKTEGQNLLIKMSELESGSRYF